MITQAFTIEEEQMIERDFESLLDEYAHTLHRQKKELITQAFHFANEAHRGVRRLSGEPYIMHPLGVAHIVVKDMGLGSTSICVALLHDVVEDTDYTVEDISNLFGEKIASIVDGLTKISGGVFAPHSSEQAENFRKLLLTMSDDIRVVLVKIADRLHNMRTLGAQPKEKQFKIAGETMYIYAPLAHRLGLYSIKEELENLAFKYENPDAYYDIERKLLSMRDVQQESFEAFVAPIRARLDTLDIKYDITARIKSIYSIWKKMSVKHVNMDEIYDLMAVRIVFMPDSSMSERDQCWRIYSMLTEIYRPHPSRIRDWLSTPKSNGYEALHVTLMGKNGQWFEVQIRTHRMHEIAERGLAAHWQYKLGESDDSELDVWLRNIRDILSNPEPEAINFLETFKLNLFAQEVFVFTPKGDIKTLPQNSTVLDFAYLLHTDMGDHCIGAKINHVFQPISYILQDGDQIEVMTDSQQVPQKNWMDMVVTAKAKTALNDYFRKVDKQYISIGEKRFKAALASLDVNDSKYEAMLHKLLFHYHFTQPSQLFLQVGNGTLSLSDLRDIVKPKKTIWQYINPFSSDEPQEEEYTPEPTINEKEKTKEKKSHTILVTDKNLYHECHICDCCRPIPGDEVLAFLDERGVYNIHQTQCPEAQRLKSSQGKSIYSVKWDDHCKSVFLATINVEGVDRIGSLIHILTIISENFFIGMHELHAYAKDGIFSIVTDVLVQNKKKLTQLIKAIDKVEGVKSVKRINKIDEV